MYPVPFHSVPFPWPTYGFLPGVQADLYDAGQDTGAKCVQAEQVYLTRSELKVYRCGYGGTRLGSGLLKIWVCQLENVWVL